MILLYDGFLISFLYYNILLIYRGSVIGYLADCLIKFVQ